MKRFKFALPILAILVVVGAALAFSRPAVTERTVGPSPAKFATVWLKYDCATGQPDLHGTTNVFMTDISGPCTGTDGTICVERYADLSNLEPVPGRPGFYQPKSVNPIEPEETFYCP